MAETRTLKATPRDGAGKGVARKLRSAGRLPAILYGHGDETRALSLNAHDVKLLVAAISVENTIIQLDIEGHGTENVLIRDVQMHPYKPEVLHVDFLQVHAGEAIRLQIPVRLRGMAVGVRDSGGVLDHVLYDLEVECLPRNIPEAVEVDVSDLEIGDSIRVGDVSLPDVKILNDPELPIVAVAHPTKRAEEEEEGVPAEGEEMLQPQRVGERDTGADADAEAEE
jgi:large subunit ribosomal protein L25